MEMTTTNIPGVLIFNPRVFGDERGFFYESYNHKDFVEKVGYNLNFVQDNHSRSTHKVLRGLHYQIQQAQGKLVRAVVGEILDIAVDIRKNSPAFGKWTGCKLSAENKKQLWIPEGFAHGFIVLSKVAEVVYKTTDYYAPQYERSILWNDPDLDIDWQIEGNPILSNKDQAGSLFKDAEVFS